MVAAGDGCGRGEAFVRSFAGSARAAQHATSHRPADRPTRNGRGAGGLARADRVRPLLVSSRLLADCRNRGHGRRPGARFPASMALVGRDMPRNPPPRARPPQLSPTRGRDSRARSRRKRAPFQAARFAGLGREPQRFCETRWPLGLASPREVITSARAGGHLFADLQWAPRAAAAAMQAKPRADGSGTATMSPACPVTMPGW